MARINVLDKHTAELIAAGEVVERPAAVVKELVENSIDAGANAVTVEIKDGGNTFIRVTDNGSGIHPDDIRTAFLRHATSKIQKEEDLNAILTLGFRGEALASICAVAKVELLTRMPDREFGIRYVINGGEEVEYDEAGCALGTTIVVRDLFYNTPARLKFLKKVNTEANAVTAVLERIAVSHPEVSIKLIKDGKTTMNTPGDNDLKSAVFSVFGKDFSDALLPVDYTLNGVAVTGFVTKPVCSRKNRNMQFFFLNGRYIRTKTAMAALEQAYKNVIMVGTYPGCVLNLSVNATEVDVNVHPAKIEVRFSDENKIFGGVYYAVKSALQADDSRVQFKTGAARQTETPVPAARQIEISLPKQTPVSDAAPPPAGPRRTNTVQDVQIGFYNQPPTVYTQPASSVNIDIFADEADKAEKTAQTAQPEAQPAAAPDISPQDEQPVIPEPAQEAAPEKPHQDFKLIGEAFDTYVILQSEDKLILIDKHAAHERILFEQIKKDAQHNPQVLLTPLQVRLSPAEYDAILEHLDAVNKAGFELEDYGDRTILIRGVPMELDGEDAKSLVIEMAGRFNEKFTDFSPEFLNWLYHSVACRAAIKAGNRSTVPELTALADRVLNDDAIRYCPHGRPVAVEMPLSDIQKNFNRI